MNRLISHLRAIPSAQRLRLVFAGLLITVLVGYLAARQLNSSVEVGRHWQQLEQRSRQLLIPAPMDARQWQQLGRDNRLHLEDLHQEEGDWMVSGLAQEVEAVEGFLSQATSLGWLPGGWQLETGGEGPSTLRFKLHLVAIAPPLPTQ